MSPQMVAQYLPVVTGDAAATVTQPLSEQLVLDNGLQVVLLPSPGSSTVTLSGYIDAGERFDAIDRAGTAALTALNLTNGTKSKDALMLAQTVEAQGIQFSASTDTEGVSLAANMLAEDLSFGVETLADILRNSVFPADQLALSQQQFSGQLAAVISDPSGLSARLFQQTVYPEGHPAHVLATPDSVLMVTQADIKSFYKAYCRPDTTVLTLVGDFDPAETRSLLTSAFGDWQTAGPASTADMPTVPIPESTVRVQESLPGSAEAITVMGYDAIARKDPRFYALQVVNEVIGGSTISSRLGDSLRDQQGLAYGVSSSIRAGIDGGPFVVTMQTAPENVVPAVESAIAILKQVRDTGITSEELESAKKNHCRSLSCEIS